MVIYFGGVGVGGVFIGFVVVLVGYGDVVVFFDGGFVYWLFVLCYGDVGGEGGEG